MHANEQALGRNWYTAQTASLHKFDDCCRIELHWSDGGLAYFLEDTQEEAENILRRYGFID